MWDVFVKRWIDMVFWWVPQAPQPAPSAPPAKPKAPPPAPKPVAEAASKPSAPAPRPAPSKPELVETKPVASALVETPKSAPTPAPAKPAVVAAAKASTPDDLTVIKGIGPAVQSKLRALGIQTFDDLAKADPDRLIDQLKGSQPISSARVRGWTEAAASSTGPAAS